MQKRILIVDDDATIRTSLSDALAEWGAECRSADDGTTALSLLDNFAPQLILCDVRMPQMGGLALLQIIRERCPSISTILMTAYDDMAIVARSMRGGAIDFLVKPIGLSQLTNVVSRAFEDIQLRGRASKSHDDGNGADDTDDGAALIGRDPRMIAVFKLVGQAAATTATVLIRGESGTGKELVARAIHTLGNSHAEPFVAVNCAALPTNLLESELFGHVRGAFTGAHDARRGRFALAGKGTVFLDEIGDTTTELQTKLLRVIQDGEYQPVGAEKSERSTARVLAATHRDLEEMISDNKFREDLYYRLRVVEIVIPPLRERAGDIPALAQHLLTKSARSLGVAETGTFERCHGEVATPQLAGKCARAGELY